jgi:hypothetical protein
LPPTVSVPTEPPGITVPLGLVKEPLILPWPLTSAPLCTVTEPPRVALVLGAEPIANVPWETSAVPVYPLLFPSRVSVPEPCLKSMPLPVNTPAKLVEFAVPTVSGMPPSDTVVPATPVRSLID